MSVSELIDHLSKLDGNRVVVMSRDSEGNGYSPLSDVEVCRYVAETTWCGELQPDGCDTGKPAVVLSPIN